jgi:hypothetical protein
MRGGGLQWMHLGKKGKMVITIAKMIAIKYDLREEGKQVTCTNHGPQWITETEPNKIEV